MVRWFLSTIKTKGFDSLNHNQEVKMRKLKDEHKKNPKKGYFEPQKSAQELIDEVEAETKSAS